VIFARKQGLAFEHLRKDTACTPDIDLDIVFLPCKHDLRRSVISCRDIASHLGVLNSSESEVANLEVAILVDQDIARFEVAMHDASGVNVFQATEDLVEEVLDKLLFEWSGGKESV
jgi:hypothetical protein